MASKSILELAAEPGTEPKKIYFVIMRTDAVAMIGTKPNEPTEKDNSNDGTHVKIWRKTIDDDENKLKALLCDLGTKYANQTMANLRDGEVYSLQKLPDGYESWVCHHYHVNHDKQEKAENVRRMKLLDADKKPLFNQSFNRKDYYYSGHPSGKLFRSLVEFLPHLIWLAQGGDGTAIAARCTCILCDPSNDSKETSDTRAKQTLSNSLDAQSQRENLAKQINEMSKERALDLSHPAPFLYRNGEIVWIDAKGTRSNWGLGVISMRRKEGLEPEYLVQPLSNPLTPLSQVVVLEKNIRAFLAWSLPNTVIKLDNEQFDNIPWADVFAGKYGNNPNDPTFVIDGSILAVKQVDATYSLFKRKVEVLADLKIDLPVIISSQPNTPHIQTHYLGMFFGTEKIWVGEAVRLDYGGPYETYVMVIHHMVETTLATPTPTPSSAFTSTPQPPHLTLVGDIYQLVETSTERHPTIWTATCNNLPQAMIEDVIWRNKFTSKRGVYNEWTLRSLDTQRALKDIRGRWYETRTTVEYLRGGDQIRAAIDTGRMVDISQDLNPRKHQSPLPDARAKNRKSALGLSVPVDFKVSRGLDGPADENVFPVEFGGAAAGGNDGMEID